MIYDVQKASVTKRFAAFLLDIILIACLAVGFMALIAVICKYDTHYNKYNNSITTVQDAVIEKYKTIFGIDLAISEDDYNNLTEEEQKQFKEYSLSATEDINALLLGNEKYDDVFAEIKGIVIKNFETENDLTYDISEEDYNALDEETRKKYDSINGRIDSIGNAKNVYMREYKYIYSLTPLMVSIGIFLSVLIFEFIIPIALKNGQTIGKKVFGLAVMHTNGVRVRPFSMFVRSILGMYVFEMMVPIYLILMAFFYHVLSGYIAIGVIVAIVILQIAVFAYTFKSTASVLHDLIARTVCVDFSSQMIFDSEEELMEFKKAQQNELAERDEYREGKKFDFYNSSLNRRNGRKIVDENGKEIVYDDEKKEESTPSSDTSQSESISVAEENSKTNRDAKKHTKRKKNK